MEDSTIAQSLPIEILEAIFEFLIDKPPQIPFLNQKCIDVRQLGQIRTCQAVCRDWHVSATSILYFQPKFILPTFIAWRKYLNNSKPSWETVIRRLNLSDVPYLGNLLTDGDIADFARFTSLSSLSLGNCRHLTNDGVIHALLDGPKPLLPRLVSLNLSGCLQLSDIAVQIIAGVAGEYGNLRHLYLNRLRRLTNVAVDAITRHLIPGLWTLEMESCYRITDDVIINLAAHADGRYPRLRRLALAGCLKISRVGFESLTRALLSRQHGQLKYENPSLSQFTLSVPSPNGSHGESEFDSVFFRFPMPLFAGLTHLSLIVGASLDDGHLHALGKHVGSTLVSLEMENLVLVTVRGLNECLEQCPNLKHLGLRSCRVIPFVCLPKLISLDLANCYRPLRDDLQLFRNLQALNISGIQHLTLERFLKIVFANSDLEYLDVSGTRLFEPVFELYCPALHGETFYDDNHVIDGFTPPYLPKGVSFADLRDVSEHVTMSKLDELAFPRDPNEVETKCIPNLCKMKRIAWFYELLRPTDPWNPLSCLVTERAGCYSSNVCVFGREKLDAIRLYFRPFFKI